MKVNRTVADTIKQAVADGSATVGGKVQLATKPLRGQRCLYVSVTLPWPPSVNHCYRATKDGKIVFSNRGRAYPRDVAACCITQGVGHVEGRLAMTIWLYPPDDNRKHDCDNCLKACLDGLMKAGVYRDDSQVEEIHVYRRGKLVGGSVRVMIQGEML